jgi:hypothetical protein
MRQGGPSLPGLSEAADKPAYLAERLPVPCEKHCYYLSGKGWEMACPELVVLFMCMLLPRCLVVQKQALPWDALGCEDVRSTASCAGYQVDVWLKQCMASSTGKQFKHPGVLELHAHTSQACQRVEHFCCHPKPLGDV